MILAIDKINQFRSIMSESGIDITIIPSTDPHFGEYIQEYYKIREWLSGFTGSAATLVITSKSAALWTDSRYFIQADEQLKESSILLMKMGVAGTPTIEEWICSQYDKGKVGLDFNLFSNLYIQTLTLNLNSFTVQDWEIPVNRIWLNRPSLNFNKIYLLQHEYSGLNSIDKLKLINSKLLSNIPTLKNGCEYIYLLSSCDDICWLCNIRGSDIPFNPLPQCYAAFNHERIYLFANLQAFDSDQKSHLESLNIEIRDYYAFRSFIFELNSDIVRVGSVAKLPKSIYDIASSLDNFINDPMPGGVVALTKASKNHVEQSGFVNSSIVDGLAWVKVLHRLDTWRINQVEPLFERDIADMFVHFRSEAGEYRGESFAPIVAYGANGALPHYSIIEKGTQILNKGLLLIDTGAHYISGTTDTTRTIVMGHIGEQEKIDYTMVLKGMISLSMATFPKGTRGASLDILARAPLYSIGKRYLHGTGHGIGHYLCVHEGPQSIRVEENPVSLEPGMVMSNEPAVYEQGKYGIRIENLIMCQQHSTTDHGQFYSFKTLTLVPISIEALKVELLTDSEKQWLNNYNLEVYNKLSPNLEESLMLWLKNVCTPI